MNRFQQSQEYLRVESKFGIERLLRVARQNRWRAIISLAAACMSMDGAVNGFGGHAPLMVGPPAFCLCALFAVLFLQASFRVFQLRHRRMAGLVEFMSRADEWWPRLPVAVADLRGPVSQPEAVPADSGRLTHRHDERMPPL